MSLGSALATAMAGLRANQAALSVTSSNIANAQTPGYISRSINQVEVTTGDIYRGVIPFIAVQLVGLALVLAFPQISLWLPTAIGWIK